MNANEHDNINHLDDMIQSAPVPHPGINADDALLTADEFGGAQPVVERDSKGNLVITLNGQVIGTMMQSKKMSYADGLKAKFDKKRLDAMNAKKAAK